MEALLIILWMIPFIVALVGYYGGLCAGINLWKERGFDTAELLLLCVIPFYGLWLIRKYWRHKESRLGGTTPT